MDKLRFKFEVLGSSDGKTNIICISSIETPHGCVYNLPDELKPASKHTAIIATDVYTKIKNSLKRRHQSRSVWIPLDATLKKVYLDEGENVQFGDQYLEEITEETVTSNNNTNQNVTENKNIGKIAERFVIEKFSSKLNADQWISEFESECERFEIISDEKKIETLKHLLEKQCQNWYSSMIMKLTVKSDWKIWKENFCETYGNKGWSLVKYAFTFKYQTGSLLEYATKKEKLLLEVNKNIDTETMINLIVLGLPDSIIDKINKDVIKSTANLYNEIGKYEYTMIKRNFTYNKNKSNTPYSKEKSDKIKPCKTCENLNKGIRFHPEERCWFKQPDERKKNYNKAVNNSVIDVELNNSDQKNE